MTMTAESSSSSPSSRRSQQPYSSSRPLLATSVDMASVRDINSNKQRRREARRERRRKRNLLLVGLLLTAVSPSLVALYFTADNTSYMYDINKNSNNDAKFHQAAIDQMVNPFVPPEQRDPNFGLPQIIVRRRQEDDEEGESSREREEAASAYHSKDNQWTQHQQDQLRDPGIVCITETLGGPCCAPWSVNTDDWWTQHYDWQVSTENQTHTCFLSSTIRNPQRAAFLKKLHHIQWKGDCSNGWQRNEISSGYAAALSAVSRSMFAAYQQGVNFQYNKLRDDFRWNFATNDTSHWAYCKAQDLTCYFLPLSHCKPQTGMHNGERGARPDVDSMEYQWLRQYAFRTRHVVRQKLQEYMRQYWPVKVVKDVHSLTPCSVIHVRRTDIAFGKGRRYLAVQEYLDAGSIKPGETVVVLTDDVSTLDEIDEYHKSSGHCWVYLRRPRFRGAQGGFEGFIPSKDPAQEVLAILAELKMASHCQKLVHGKSGFVALIQEAMLAASALSSVSRGNRKPQFIYLDNQQDKGSQPQLDPDVRADKYLHAIRETNSKGVRSSSQQ